MSPIPHSMYDLVVVGAGPAGCCLAGLVADKGYRVLVVEEHPRLGEPVQCAGLVTPRVAELAEAGECILNRVSGATIYGPSEQKMVIRSKDREVLVIDRGIFDRTLGEVAVSKGAEILLDTRASAILEKKDGCIVDIGDRKVETRYVAGCDGPSSIVRRRMGLPTPKILAGVSVEGTTTGLEEDMVALRCGNKFAPGFFAWAIPVGNGRVRIGLAVDPKRAVFPAREYLERIINSPRSLGMTSPIEGPKWSCGVIPVSPPKKCASQRMLLVGDSACQVKATSGGGIVMGLTAAEHASNVLSKRLSENSKEGLQEYNRLWQGDIGKEVRRDWAMHSYYSRMDDSRLEKAFSLLSREDVVQIINNLGDIDYPSRLVLPLIHACPSLSKMMAPILWEYTRSYLY